MQLHKVFLTRGIALRAIGWLLCFAVSSALATMPDLVPSISTYHFGADLGVNGSVNMDFAIVATFASFEDWRSYNEDPDHDRIRREVIVPLVAERASVQFTS